MTGSGAVELHKIVVEEVANISRVKTPVIILVFNSHNVVDPCSTFNPIKKILRMGISVNVPLEFCSLSPLNRCCFRKLNKVPMAFVILVMVFTVENSIKLLVEFQVEVTPFIFPRSFLFKAPVLEVQVHLNWCMVRELDWVMKDTCIREGRKPVR